MEEIISFEYQGRRGELKLMPIEPSVDERSFAPRPAILICPGGGYTFTSDREAEPVARYFNAAGFHCFVLRYSVNDGKGCFPAPVYQAAKAMEFIRDNAEQWNLDPNRVAVMGFSAGAHLAAWLANGWSDPFFASIGLTGGRIYRPDAQVLCYPVITTGEFSDDGSVNNLCGCDDFMNSPDFPQLSCEKMVTADSPRAFLWQTRDDDLVPIENTLLMTGALQQHKVPFELHLYESGPHGLSLCDENTEMVARECASWKKLCVAFLRRM